jgi:hypothetical protein
MGNQDLKLARFTKLVIGFLLLLKLMTCIYFPFPNGDGPWALSHTFSILNGHFFESRFAHSYMGFYNLPYLYGWLNAPFYYLFTKTNFLEYSIFICNFIWVILIIVLSSIYLKKTVSGESKFFLLALCFLLSPYTYSLRPEIFNLPLLITLVFLLDEYVKRNKYLWLIALLVTLIGLIHPVGGLYACFFVAAYFYERNLELKKLLLTAAGVLLWLFILYGPVVFSNFALWRLNFFHRGYESDSRHVSLSIIFKFLFYNPLFAVILFIHFFSVPKEKLITEIAFWAVCILVFIPFGRSYYLPYLMQFLLWRLALNKKFYKKTAWLNYAVLLSAFVALFISYIWPSCQIFENQDYIQQFKSNLLYISDAANTNQNKLIWVSPFTAMKIIDKENARLFVPSLSQLSGTIQTAKHNDFFLLENPRLINALKNWRTVASDSLIVKEIYKPVKGFLRFGANGQRSDSLGLWMVTVKRKPI